MDPSTMSPQQLFLYSTLINAAVGLVFGLVPLIAGFVRGKRRIGFFGFVACAVGGALLGVILSVPAMLISTWMIFKSTKSAENTSADAED